MHRTQRCFLASGCSSRRQQRDVAEGSPSGEPIGHALVAVRHKRRRRAVTYFEYALRAPSRPGRGPQRRPLRAPWVRIRGAATTAMFLHRRGAATKKAGTCRRNPPMEAKGGRSRPLPAYGHSLPRVGHKPRSGAVTLRADGGRGRSLRCSSSTMLGHRLLLAP